MSYEVYKWILAGHVYTFMMWTGTLFAAIHILGAHSEAGSDGSAAFLKLEKATGMAMDIGATLAIIFGVIMIVVPEGGTAIFKAGGFFHAKLTLVAAFIGIHVMVRKTMMRFKKGDTAAPASWLFPAASICVLGIVVMMIARPF